MLKIIKTIDVTIPKRNVGAVIMVPLVGIKNAITIDPAIILDTSARYFERVSS